MTASTSRATAGPVWAACCYFAAKDKDVKIFEVEADDTITIGEKIF